MDHWPSDGTGSSMPDISAYHGRVLASTSGNVQLFPSDTKSHLDFRQRVSCGEHTKSDSHFIAALPVLGSNDKQVLHDRLAARKARRSTHLIHDRPYLQAEKYKIYRGRKRQDEGDDGKPIWPDHIEDSFQNAMVQIPPMGKRKKTQYGRPRGRNELIAEWIRQETGEERTRKQVSSHIQVLSKLLEDMPEWKSLTKAPDGNDDYVKDETEYNYYFESIADRVRLLRQQAAQANQDDLEAESWLETTFQRHSLSKLTFELWVGAPDNITQALHNYTRIPNPSPLSPAVPLENFDNWRYLFPDLEATIQASPDESFDLLLINSSITLMSDFPPKTSKLGLVLDLDFRSPGHENIKSLSALKRWSSVNHMYLHGQSLRKTEHKECQSAEFGLVKPFFEADWWASHFTKLTHRTKEAENSQDEYVVSTADERSRTMFRELSIMQEVFASPAQEQDSTIPRRRMAVLLWTFSQAKKGQSGVTTWQKVIPPPNRMGSNSPLAPTSSVDSSLPPLVLDSMVESSFDTSMTEHDFSHQATEPIMPFSPMIYESGSYHSGFTPLQNMNHEHLKLYDFTSTGLTPRHGDFVQHKNEMFNFNAPIPTTAPINLQQAQQFLRLTQQRSERQPNSQANTYRDDTINIFDNLPDDDDLHENSSIVPTFPSLDRRQCLANFDVSTHQMLQAQLSKVQPKVEVSSPEDYAMLEPDSQQSVTGHMNDLELDVEAMSQSLISDPTVTYTSPIDAVNHDDVAISHPSIFLSPKLSRPPLMPHNSFAGVLRTTSRPNGEEQEQLGFDTPTRNDFARLMDNHYFSASDDELFGSNSAEGIECRASVDGNSILRPRSQPNLPSNMSPITLRENGLNLDLEQQNIDVHSNIKVEQQ